MLKKVERFRRVVRKILKRARSYLKATGVLEFVAFVSCLGFEIGITTEHLFTSFLNILRILKNLYFLRRYLIHLDESHERARYFNGFNSGSKWP